MAEIRFTMGVRRVPVGALALVQDFHDPFDVGQRLTAVRQIIGDALAQYLFERHFEIVGTQQNEIGPDSTTMCSAVSSSWRTRSK